MLGDRDYRDDALIGPIVPEHAPGRRGLVLYVALPNLLTGYAFDRVVLVRVQTWMARILLDPTKGATNLGKFLLVLGGLQGSQDVLSFTGKQ